MKLLTVFYFYLLSSLLNLVHANPLSLEEAFELDLFNNVNNKIQLGMYSNEGGDKSSLGVEFKFNKDFGLSEPNYPNKNNDRFTPPTVGPSFSPEELLAIGQDDYSALSNTQKERLFAAIDHSVDDYSLFHINLSAEGLLALDNENNLKDFMQFRAEGAYKVWQNNQYTYGGGIFSAYETDQSNDNEQIVYGFTINGQYYFNQGKANEYAFFKLDYSEVDPSKNIRRFELLNGDQSTFNRWEIDTTVQFEISIQQIDKIELSYRYFYESSAPPEIQKVGMNKFSFFTAGIFFQQGWFIAFSDGELPFSVQDEQVFELGWSYSFK